MTHSRLQNYNAILGKLILEDYLTPLNLTIGDLAKALNVSPEFLLTFQVMQDIRQLKNNKVFQEELDNIEPLIKK